VPMDSSGITVREIPSIVGRGDIHEVFFDDVFVPEAARLGAEADAWSIISFSLANERVGIPRYALARRVLNRSVELLKRRGAYDQMPEIRQRSGQALAACEAAQMLAYKAVDQRARGMPPSIDASVCRLAVIAAERATAEFVIEFLPEGMSGELPFIQSHHQRAITASIAAGAAEIQLNLVARDLLGLPR
jgi:alkylation response protein AidB-like acyl-CoA dehydrogenase